MRRALLFVLLAAMPASGETLVLLCTAEPPQNAYEVPRCEEYELNDGLIAAGEQGDASALALLQRRYADTDTYVERHRIARAVLGNVPDDAAIWKEILADAELAVRFAEVEQAELPPGFEEWCEKRGFDPYGHGVVLDAAFSLAAQDPRAHDLLMRALDSTERNIAFTAAATLAEQDDATALPGIERALQRFNSYSFSLASVIEEMTDPRAKALARKYLEDEEDSEDVEDQEDEQ